VSEDGFESPDEIRDPEEERETVEVEDPDELDLDGDEHVEVAHGGASAEAQTEEEVAEVVGTDPDGDGETTDDTPEDLEGLADEANDATNAGTTVEVVDEGEESEDEAVGLRNDAERELSRMYRQGETVSGSSHVEEAGIVGAAAAGLHAADETDRDVAAVKEPSVGPIADAVEEGTNGHGFYANQAELSRQIAADKDPGGVGTGGEDLGRGA
jgi:hypothetical protein